MLGLGRFIKPIEKTSRVMDPQARFDADCPMAVPHGGHGPLRRTAQSNREGASEKDGTSGSLRAAF